MILGLLQCGHVPDAVQAKFGDYPTLYAAMFPGRDYDIRPWLVFEGEMPPGPDAADAWLISGSRFGAYEGHDWIAPLEALIRGIADAGRPLVGICFGHQIIAQALGGRVAKFDGGWTLGLQTYRIGDRVLRMNAWHQDQVLDLPPGAVRLGSSATCANAAFAIGAHILTLQAHPEFHAALIETMIAVRGGDLPADRVAHADAHLAGPDDNGVAHAWIAHVLEGGAVADLPLAARERA